MATKESNTRSFVLRIDAETMDAIEKWAEDEFRSTNGQLQWIIAEALRKAGASLAQKRVKPKTRSNGYEKDSELRKIFHRQVQASQR